MSHKLVDIFQKYTGRELPTALKDVVIRGQTFRIPRLSDDNDPTLAAMAQTARAHGYSLHVWFPCSTNPKGRDDKRVNAFVQETRDGRWFISPTYFLG